MGVGESKGDGEGDGDGRGEGVRASARARAAKSMLTRAPWRTKLPVSVICPSPVMFK